LALSSTHPACAGGASIEVVVLSLGVARGPSPVTDQDNPPPFTGLGYKISVPEFSESFANFNARGRYHSVPLPLSTMVPGTVLVGQDKIT